MIAYVEGKVVEKAVDRVVVSAGGVGYELFVSASTLGKVPAKGEDVSLQAYLHVREGVMQLFGFWTKEEKDLFEKLISIPGIGPKLAVAILSVFSVSSFKEAVLAADIDAVTSIPGIGRKSAQRLIVELREKLAMPAADVAPTALLGEEGQMVYAEVKNALVGLGYTAGEAKKALEGYTVPDGEKPEVDDMLKWALRNLANL